MHINVFVTPGGRFRGSWQAPDSGSEDIFGLPYIARIAQQCERAKLDAVFIADLLTTEGEAWGKSPSVGMHEPISVLSAVAAITSKIGLVASISTSFSEPFSLARMMSSLDHLSKGRAGWNIVTSFAGEDNFSSKLLPHDMRYARAKEYVDVVTALWDSWEDTAIVNDKSAGFWARPERLHPINHEGEYFKVKGPLNVARPPQGWPVLVQAGVSETGADFAASVAEVIFGQHLTMEEARKARAAIHDAARAKGRDPSRIKTIPGLMPIIGDTEEEAQAIARELADYAGFAAQPARFQEWMIISCYKSFTLEGVGLDDPIPMDRFIDPSQVEGFRSRYEVYYKLALEGKTFREVLQVFSGGGGGHPVIIGTAEQVADEMERWFINDACDGFQLMPSHYFGGLDAITDKLIPHLQARGLFRKNYTGNTLRDHYGLNRPPGRRETPIHA